MIEGCSKQGRIETTGISTAFVAQTSAAIIDSADVSEVYKGKKISTNFRSCVPLTIAQVKKRVRPEQEQFMLETKELTDVCLVGIIRAIIQQQASITYLIEDGTASIDVKQWNNPAEDSSDDIRQESLLETEAYPRDIYVKVFGRIQSFQDRIFLISHRLMPIVDHNEVSFHLLSAIHTHLHLIVNRKPSPLSSNNVGESIHKLFRNNSNKNINSIVRRAIKVCGDEELGSHISNVMSHLKGMFNEAEVLKALGELVDDGQIYRTDEYVQLVDF